MECLETVGNRIVLALYNPLPTDSKFAFVRQFREEAALVDNLTFYSNVDGKRSSTQDVYTFIGYLMAKFAIQLHLDMPVQTVEQLRETLFSNRIITVEDKIYV